MCELLRQAVATTSTLGHQIEIIIYFLMQGSQTRGMRPAKALFAARDTLSEILGPFLISSGGK